MSPKLTSARAFIILPNRLSAAFKNGFFSIVRAKLITEEESSRRTPKLGLAGHHRKRLAAECATCPCNILEMADVHHIPPLSPAEHRLSATKSIAPPRCIADVPTRLAATRPVSAEARPLNGKIRRYLSDSPGCVTAEVGTATSLFSGRSVLLASP